jgi:hypothetical protein
MILSAKKIGFQLNAIISNHLEFQRVKSDEVELNKPHLQSLDEPDRGLDHGIGLIAMRRVAAIG